MTKTDSRLCHASDCRDKFRRRTPNPSRYPSRLLWGNVRGPYSLRRMCPELVQFDGEFSTESELVVLTMSFVDFDPQADVDVSKTEALLGIKSRRLCRLLIVYRPDGHAESLSHPGREIVNRLTANPQLMGDAGIRRALH